MATQHPLAPPARLPMWAGFICLFWGRRIFEWMGLMADHPLVHQLLGAALGIALIVWSRILHNRWLVAEGLAQPRTRRPIPVEFWGILGTYVLFIALMSVFRESPLRTALALTGILSLVLFFAIRMTIKAPAREAQAEKDEESAWSEPFA